MLKLLIITCLSLAVFTARSSDMFSALAEFETGNDNTMVGRHGERTAYQILPREWRRWRLKGENWNNRQSALAVAHRIMTSRESEFLTTYKRLPTAFEWYVLWNAPADLLVPGNLITTTVAEKAYRFSNLVQKYGISKTSKITSRARLNRLSAGSTIVNACATAAGSGFVGTRVPSAGGAFAADFTWSASGSYNIRRWETLDVGLASQNAGAAATSHAPQFGCWYWQK